MCRLGKWSIQEGMYSVTAIFHNFFFSIQKLPLLFLDFCQFLSLSYKFLFRSWTTFNCNVTYLVVSSSLTHRNSPPFHIEIHRTNPILMWFRDKACSQEGLSKLSWRQIFENWCVQRWFKIWTFPRQSLWLPTDDGHPLRTSTPTLLSTVIARTQRPPSLNLTREFVLVAIDRTVMHRSRIPQLTFLSYPSHW